MNGDKWYGLLGPNDWFESKDRPVYYLFEEEYVRRYAESHPDTIVWEARQ